MKTQHTPGPWNANGNYIEDKAGTIAKVMRPEDNAALIAAAPELLEALENLLDQLHIHHKMNLKKDYSLMLADSVARAAIAKAKGE